MTQTKIIFAGTPDLAATILAALLAEPSFKVVAVLSQPDMPSGRKQLISPTPVKALALEHNIEVLQPQRITQVADQLRALDTDFLVVAAYAQLIPDEILALPRFESLNVHASLLPHYRGASVIQAPILSGDAQTGISIMRMVAKLDAGPIFAQAKVNISPTDTAESLSDKLSQLAGPLLVQTIKDIASGQLKPEEQDHTQASYAKKLNKSDGLIDWTRDAKYLERFIRAMHPWPSAWTWLTGRQLKIIAAKEILPLNTYKPGKVFVYNNQLAIQTGQDALLISRLQAEGKKPMTSSEFINGHSEIIGAVLA